MNSTPLRKPFLRLISKLLDPPLCFLALFFELFSHNTLNTHTSNTGTAGKTDLGGVVPEGTTMAAHPRFDANTGR
jgi:hypothetical protein